MTTTDPIDLAAIQAQLDDPYNCMHPNSRRDLTALLADVKRLTAQRDRLRAAVALMFPVVEVAVDWHEAPAEAMAWVEPRLRKAVDAYTASQPRVDSDAWVLPEGVTTYRMWWLRVRGGTYRMASLQAALDGRAKGFIAGAAPGEGEVLYCDEFRPARTPFRVWTGGADEPAQDAARGTAGPDVGEETPGAPRGAEEALTFTERRASRDPSVDHESHSMQWVGGKCPECPDNAAGTVHHIAAKEGR